ncbi:MAG TPA: carboxypeptidase-like regulatory domain-containing protein [Candidatus Eremiobacteraceae bacterium]|nr:carboxypeptidase-like regulatory domain-containing protein [Candidatus Eremiobacteraceae bacterium]
MTTPNVYRNGSPARRSAFYLLLVLAASTLGPLVLPAVNAAPATKKLKPTDPYALIFGTVWGPDNRPVYGVKVSIRRMPDKKPKWEVYSDHAGEFAQRVPAGEADYQIEPDLKSLKTADGNALHLAEEVTVHVEYDERVDMSLHLTR